MVRSRLTHGLGCAALVAGGLVGTTTAARAQALPSGGDIQFDRLLIHEDGADELSIPSTESVQRRYFNFAHCMCSNASAGKEQTFALSTRLVDAGAQYDVPGEVYLGSQCDDDEQRPLTCSREDGASIADIDTLATSAAVAEVKVSRIMGPLDTSCEEDELKGSYWVLVDTDTDGSFDYVATASIDTDSLPPPVPTDFVAAGAEAAVSLSWTAPTARASDIEYYQALCARPDGTPALETTSLTARYETVSGLCELEFDNGLVPAALEDGTARAGGTPDAALAPDAAPPDAALAPDAMPSDLPDGLADLDPAFLCGEATGGAATGMRIEGLENGVDYTVALVAVDKFGNFAGVYFTETVRPEPVTDFWEDLQDRGSKVRGGFCSAADDAGGAAGSLLLVLGAVGLVLARSSRRRRGGARAAAVTTLLGVGATALLGAPAARADINAVTPYWDDDFDDSDLSAPEVRWHVGLKLGPYTPGIDAQFAAQGGMGTPYADMFGGYTILPQLDVDWIFANPLGQLGVSGSIGVTGKTAKAFAAGSMPGDPDRPRAESDTTSFRLVPLSAGLIYRFSYFDDMFGVPLIPYVRGALSYYVWWMRAPDGDYAEFFPDGCDPEADGCEGDRALGGTAGVQGSIGLAVRAERIDAGAAASMRASGIEHAGFYAELSLAKVDGFGSDQRLAVGDTTWFAGIDFEF
jgi:hypothetical protein